MSGSELRRIGTIGGIARDQLPAHRVAKRPMQHDVNPSHRGGGEGTAVLTTALEQTRVQLVEHRTVDPVEALLADVGADVVANVGFIAVEGGGSDRGLDGWEPPIP